MDDYSKLKDGIPVTSVSERVWGVPKKRRAADGDSNRGGPRKKNADREKREEQDQAMVKEERPEPEEPGYGCDGIRKKRNAQVDVII
jgi:hypothetical protein